MAKIKEVVMFVEGLFYSDFSREEIAKMGSREFNISEDYIKKVYDDFVWENKYKVWT